MSHRYGTRCLPTRVIAKEFETLRNELKENEHFRPDELSFQADDPDTERKFLIENLLENCYELDMNEIPHRYKLKELEKIIPKYNEKDPKCGKIWRNIENKLGFIFRTLARTCLAKGTFSETECSRFFVSGIYLLSVKNKYFTLKRLHISLLNVINLKFWVIDQEGCTSSIFLF